MRKSDDKNSIRQLIQHGYRYAFSLTHNVASSEDLVQDAWLSILKNRAPQNKAYFFTVIRNNFFNQSRREKLIPLVSIEDVQTEEDLKDGEADFSDILANREQLNQSLAQLRPIEREVVFLYFVEEYTTLEIAKLVDLSKGTVCSLIFRSRRKLKVMINAESTEVAL